MVTEIKIESENKWNKKAGSRSKDFCMGAACQHAYRNQNYNIYKRREKKTKESPNQ